MVKFLQINLRKSGSARRMMEHTSRELGSDILVLSEVPRGPPDSQRWVSSSDGKAAVVLTEAARMAPVDVGRGQGYACMLLPGLLVYSL